MTPFVIELQNLSCTKVPKKCEEHLHNTSRYFVFSFNFCFIGHRIYPSFVCFRMEDQFAALHENPDM